jgi:MFS family permease
MIEWYDFYIFGSLAAVLSVKFYPPGNDTFALIAYLATFAAGFLVRPFGALFFGSIGDRIGRKYTFLLTLSIMGGSTALIGLMPTFTTAGWFPCHTDCDPHAPGAGPWWRVRRRSRLCR